MHLLVLALLAAHCLGAAPRRPNIVILFADDAGAGDFGFMGAPTIRTPNLDRLAFNGVRMTTWYSGAPVCTPSRAALLTGRLPIRYGMAGRYFPAANVSQQFNCAHGCVLPCDARHGLPANESTLAEQLHAAGYATGMVGKWHLGQQAEFNPTRRGFDMYLGIPFSTDQGGVDGAPCVDPNCTPLPLLDGEAVVQQPVNMSDLALRYAARATGFIKAHAEEPFFLYMAFSHVHVGNPGDIQYTGSAFDGVSQRGRFGDAVEEMDWLAGQVIDTVDELGLGEDTIIFFTSDNGPWDLQGINGGSHGPYTGAYASAKLGYQDTGKNTAWEAGMRMPAAVRWTGTIEPLSVVTETVTTMDIFPTALRLAGVDVSNLTAVLDGRDMLDVLLGAGKSPHEAVFLWRQGALFSVRYKNWKVSYATACGGCLDPFPQVHDPPLLFDVDQDPAEKYPLDTSQHKDVLADVAKLVQAHLQSIGTPPEEVLTPHNSSVAVCCDRDKECRCNA